MFFLRFYERRNKFRFQLPQQISEKNNMRKELSACLISKCNGFEFLRNSLKSKEKKDFIPIDIVYKWTLNDQKPIECFFAPKIEMAYNAIIELVRQGKKNISYRKPKQCHYCENGFIKSEGKMQEHLSCCSGKAGFNYVFYNRKILNYQDNYGKIGDLPFTIYYDFETTTGSVAFFDAKMFVVSYFVIAAFHPELNIPRIVIYRSYDQHPDALKSPAHFQVLEYDFFSTEKINKTTLKQLENAAFSVQNRENNTVLAEMFNIELKFTGDCLKLWFQKHKVLELNEETKLNFRENDPQANETLCCLCDFPLNPRLKNGWAEHVFKAEYFFLENIFSQKQLAKMGIDNFEVYSEKLNKILENLDQFCASINREGDSDVHEIIQKIKKS